MRIKYTMSHLEQNEKSRKGSKFKRGKLILQREVWMRTSYTKDWGIAKVHRRTRSLLREPALLPVASLLKGQEEMRKQNR